MSNAIVALVVIALMIIAALTWSQAAFSSFDSVSQSLKQMAQTTQEVNRTNISIIDAQEQGTNVEVAVHNSGEIRLTQFADWDVLVQYYDATDNYHIRRLAYTENSDPGDNEWAVATIYSDQGMTQEEVFEPGILNPGEVALLRLKLSPQPGNGTTNLVSISTFNGVNTSAQFNG
jgi:archaellum component FlaF (FlaF/FlaG flagellin family)